MERGHITITEQGVRVNPVQGTVWLSEHQIASLFDVFVSKVGSNIRSIFKNRLLQTEEVMHTHHFDGGSVDLYNLEMITALAYRIDSPKATIFRKWTMRRQTAREKVHEPIVVCYQNGTLLN